MIYIDKKEKLPLPARFRKVNNIAAHIYDQLSDFLHEDYYKGLSDFSIDVDKDNQEFIDKLESGEMHILEWLKHHQLNKELTLILTRHITLSVLADMLNFIYESFSCAKRGKMSVAYALLRKPFTDELLILEQLLCDPEDFITRFYHSGDPAGYDPSDKNLDKKAIIQKVVEKIRFGGCLEPGLLYDLRYDKTIPNGLNGLSNHALHIVTKDKNYRTTDRNFNFIFSVEEDYKKQCAHYYYFVPYLLIYAACVVDELLFPFLPGERFENLKAIKGFKRYLSFLFMHDENSKGSRKGTNSILKVLQGIMLFNCPKCKKLNSLRRKDYEQFIESEDFYCGSCGSGLLTTTQSLTPILGFMKMVVKTPTPRI